MMQEMTNRSLFEVPDLHFDCLDALSGARFVLKRSEGLARQRMGIMDEKGLMFAYTDWKFHLVWKKYEVCSALDGSKLMVQNQLLHPFTLKILDVMEEAGGHHRERLLRARRPSHGWKQNVSTSAPAKPTTDFARASLRPRSLPTSHKEEDKAKATGVFKF